MNRLTAFIRLLRDRANIFELLLAVRHGHLAETLDRYRKQIIGLDAYRRERGQPVVERIALRETSYTLNIGNVQRVFASSAIRQVNPQMIHDIGSDRQWIIGVSTHYNVTSLDVREPPFRMENEHFDIGQAQALPWETASVEFLTSMHSIEHFGLGGYGDDQDTWGDNKAAAEMARVVKPGGELILTTTVTGNSSFTAYDVHRVYSADDLHDMLTDFEIIEEKFVSSRNGKVISRDQLITEIGPWKWDFYMVRAKRKLTRDQA